MGEIVLVFKKAHHVIIQEMLVRHPRLLERDRDPAIFALPDEQCCHSNYSHVGRILAMNILLFFVAFFLALWGIVQLLDGAILWGLLLLVAAAAIGPGGWTIYNRRG